jgi:hypothetical protein
MPFRTIQKDVAADEPVKLLVAEAGDIEVQIRSTAYGAAGASSGYSFLVGGPEVEGGGGLYVFSGEWNSTIEEGDEIWIAAAETMEFRNTTPVTAIIRSRKAPEVEPVKPVPASTRSGR